MRVRKLPEWLIEVKLAEATITHGCIPGEIFALSTLYPHRATNVDDPLVVYKATSDPDTMYLHEAMRESDRDDFLRAMQKEIDDQMHNGNFTMVRQIDVPKDKTILPAVWQMKWKRDIKTCEVKKYKAQLNIDGSRMKYSIHYDQTYAPVAAWSSVHLLLTLSAAFGWKTKQLDYVLARERSTWRFPKALS